MSLVCFIIVKVKILSLFSKRKMLIFKEMIMLFIKTSSVNIKTREDINIYFMFLISLLYSLKEF